jgi:hypothetical protein
MYIYLNWPFKKLEFPQFGFNIQMIQRFGLNRVQIDVRTSTLEGKLWQLQ